ncbi:phage/plasmid primase, P4 family [Roseomonas sp. E05]|uniref:phage/plasmid primase, P4 family n=1 Tax=Roseomonas sp. E05 TaxID=3046310 RepID=UPI0024BB1E41|nr:phage/plasmid primase, P4 family [Roseomonas sp. E05]MDJ0391489.1 phage/plasmid primase, P4 family [Roseomonas sp. E05]
MRASSVLPENDFEDQRNGIALADLAALPRWVAWQTEGRGPEGKPTKVPYSPLGAKARADSPATWGTRDAAEIRAEVLPRPFGAGGVGIELGDHAGLAIGGIDLDTCRDAESGVLAPWAAEVVERFGSYTEVSPSGTGVKIFFVFEGTDLPALRSAMGSEHGRQFKRKGAGDHPPAIELYLGNRYFAVTGQHLANSPAEMRPVEADTIGWLLSEAGPSFAAGGVAPSQPGRLERALRLATNDGSRSGAAFKIAAEVKRTGGTYDNFRQELDADPTTAAWKAEKGMANGERELRRAWERAGQTPANDDDLLTESAVADQFATWAEHRLRYCHDSGLWYEWTGTHWKADRKHAAFTYARRLTGDLSRTAEAKIQAITGKAAFCGGVEKFAQRDERLAVTAEDWDPDAYLLATPGGTVDLRTGKMRAAQPGDMMTRLTAVAPSRRAPPDLWLRFLDETTGKDDELIGFLQQWCGYCLTGDTREHALVFGHGGGGNGKSVFLDTVSGIMGDYAAVAAMDTFTASQGDKHPTDLAALRGARMVVASETEEGRAWAESRIKALTGGDKISARFMRQDFFTYQPQFKLTIIGNHKPVLKNLDEAMRRRMNLVPFTRKPATKDLELKEKLKAEWPAILAWMIDGCLAWQADGLTRPPVVIEATAEYFAEQDYFARWLAECCILDATLSTKPAALLASFHQWCQANGEEVADNKRLRGMIERTPGLRYITPKGIQWVRGIGLRSTRGDEKVGGWEGGGGSNP